MIVPFTIHDAVKLGYTTGMSIDASLRYARLVRHGDAFAYRDAADVPRLAGGILPIWGRVGECWLLVDEAMRGGLPRAVARYVKRGFALIAASRGYVRLQAHVAADNARDLRFAEWLGLERESLMRRYLPDGGDAWRVVFLAREGGA